MRRLQFSIQTLLAVVLFVCLSCAALRARTELWDSGLFAGMLGSLLVATLLAAHRVGRKRAFWIGFALFGWVYLGLSLVPPIESRLPTTKLLAQLDSNYVMMDIVEDASTSIGPTTRALAEPGSKVSSGEATPRIQSQVLTDLPSGALPPVALPTDPTSSAPAMIVAVDDPAINRGWIRTGLRTLVGGSTGASENLRRIGHSLVTLMLAFAGGHLSCYLERRQSAPGMNGG
jgi:hypothetical protein